MVLNKRVVPAIPVMNFSHSSRKVIKSGHCAKLVLPQLIALQIKYLERHSDEDKLMKITKSSQSCFNFC